MLLPTAFFTVSWLLQSFLILVSQVQGEIFQPKEEHTQRISCKEGTDGTAFPCYALFMTPKSWMNANMYCQKWPSGHLVSVLSESEASFVASMVKNNLGNSDYVWIGLYDPTEGTEPNGGEWEWISNDMLYYHAWEKNPPTFPYSGYCGSLIGKSGYLKWKDFDCDLLLPYVCKFKD
ncbi:regenerating islet-derived protein 3-gamma-like [Erinaceus europaeus]|uniref:Regenerating islet-derived protein 3-gamma-like n=1 Tax=Erinaceus europaeus TaxID=9365 RepID=A0ABM3X6X7_ERIEU|nr:regenerating islet-derived protein 3-gamma-like [Erinaceus europaeus]